MFDKLKNMLNKDKEKGSKKQIENLIALIIILVITVIAINNIWNNKNSKEDKEIAKEPNQSIETSQIATKEEFDLQTKIEEILSQMSGIEDIDVLLNYSETSSVVAMYNENTTNSATEETDSSGGVRTITQTDVKKEVVFSDEDGNTSPVTEKVVMPKVEGAIIMIKGKDDAETKSKIISAVSAVTGLATHKIQVLSMN